MAALSLAGCSDDENGNGGNGGNGGSGEGGNPSGGDLTEILFEDGTQIGDGRQEFEIKGDYTLPKGTYLLKGWCYIADGASLTLAPGTIIKGDKETKAALIVEPGGQLWAKGTQSEPIVFTSEMPAGSRRPGDWGGIILCGRGVNNKGTMQIEGGPRTTQLRALRVRRLSLQGGPGDQCHHVRFCGIGYADRPRAGVLFQRRLL